MVDWGTAADIEILGRAIHAVADANMSIEQRANEWRHFLRFNILKKESRMSHYMDKDRLARFLNRLFEITKQDIKTVSQKDQDYGGSWKKYGGVGAYFNVARKWDRIEAMVKGIREVDHGSHIVTAPQYDLFGHVQADPSHDGLIESIRDLRGYLLLVEEELMELNIVDEEFTGHYDKQEDN